MVFDVGFASICGKAVANPDSPRAFGTCDRCGTVYNHNQLHFQFDYRGRALANLRILVCDRCTDTAQPQLKPRIIPIDPVPIKDARPYPYCAAEVDDRTTTNPALPLVDFATGAPILLSGLQFIGAHQLQHGELVLVMGQTNPAENGVYKASTGAWARQGFDNARKTYIAAVAIDTSWSRGTLYLGQLGIYLGAVYVGRGVYATKLYQITFDPSQPVGVGPVTASTVAASTVNRIDLRTGIYMEGVTETRVTQEGYVRTPQQVGSAPGNTNEIPGYNQIVPGACDIGQPTQAPYGCATRQGLPPSMDTLPFAGSLWPTLSNQSIGYWLTDGAFPAVWVNNYGVQVTFKSLGFWPNPGPGKAAKILAYKVDYSRWTNVFGQTVPWNNVLNQTVFWSERGPYGIFPPGGDTLWTNDKCDLILWHNKSGDNVDFAEIYPNAIKPNKPAPWPWGWN